jgi:hypothetical protein
VSFIKKFAGNEWMISIIAGINNPYVTKLIGCAQRSCHR